MKRAQILGISLILVLTFMAACAPKVTPVPQAPAAPAKTAWEGEWNKVMTAAKQGGKLVIASSGGPRERDTFIQGMKGFGVEAAVTMGRVNEVLPKIKAERQAGLYLWDIHIGGYHPVLITVKPEGLVDYPLDPYLILPDVTDPDRIKKVWYRGVFPWADKDHSVFITALEPAPPLIINTNLVKEGEIKSYRDLLDPKWKGKMIIGDPTIPSAAQQYLSAIIKIMGEDFIKEVVQTEPMLTRDERLQVDWVTRGKMAIGLIADDETINEFQKAGAPIKVVTPVEGGFISGQATGVSLWKNAPNTNAAKVFMNWIATREGQELYAPAGGYHSLRLDVSTAHLRPGEMRQPGVKYLDASTEEFSFYRRDVANKIIMREFEKLIKK